LTLFPYTTLFRSNKGYEKGTERGVELYHDALMEKLQLAPDNSDKEPTDLEGSENN
jgi:hypothetical protein